MVLKLVRNSNIITDCQWLPHWKCTVNLLLNFVRPCWVRNGQLWQTIILSSIIICICIQAFNMLHVIVVFYFHYNKFLCIVQQLDMLWTKKQSVFYTIFEWCTWPDTPLILVAIANTMDLPERMLIGRITSRLVWPVMWCHMIVTLRTGRVWPGWSFCRIISNSCWRSCRHGYKIWMCLNTMQ